MTTVAVDLPFHFLTPLVSFLLSWLIRQIGNGVVEEEDPEELEEEEEGEENESLAAVDGGTEFEPYEPIVQVIKIAIVAFSALLLGLSLTAYRKTALRSIVYAAVAFGLFAVQTFFDYLEDAVKAFEQPYNDIIFYAMTLAILVLFFMAIVRKKTR